MTQVAPQKKNKLIFATKTAQQVPFSLGDRTFFSRRLTGEEEIIFGEIVGLRGMQVDVQAQLQRLIDFLAALLGRRVTEGEAITVDWVSQYVGDANLDTLMGYLRTGHNGPGLVPAPGTSLNLPTVELDLDEQVISGPAMNFAELLRYMAQLPDQQAAAAAMSQIVQDPSALLTDEGKARVSGVLTELSDLRRAQYTSVAEMLAVRQGEGQEPVTAQWLLDNYSVDEIGQMYTLLHDGAVAEEADTPNAPMPANLPING